MKNSIPQKSKVETPQLVVIGPGLSGIDFLLGWQDRFEELHVTVFEKSGISPFLLEALFLVKDKKLLPIPGNESGYQMENLRFSFTSSIINSVDPEKNVLYHSAGQFYYDYLLIVNEFDLKVKLKNGDDFTAPAFFETSYESGCQNFNNKKVVIEGHGLATMAMAIKFLEYGLSPSIVCRNSRLAIDELPAEEAWLFSKYFKKKGIDLNFETRIENFFTEDKSDLIGVKIGDGKELLVCKVLVVDDENPCFSLLKLNEFYLDTVLKTNNRHGVLGYTNVYAVGEKVEMCAEEAGELVGSKFIYGIGNDNYSINNSFKQFVFKELTWQTYGGISPVWGNDTQNFYWEHPAGDIAFRLHYKKVDFSIIGMACIGISFDKSFVIAALQSNLKAYDFIDGIGEGLIQNKFSTEVYPLIKKSFEVEFKKVMKNYRSSLLKRMVRKLIS